MKEILELRINNKFIELLPPQIVAKDLGPVSRIKIEKGSPEFEIVREIAEKVKGMNGESFFYGWGLERNYSKREMDNANLFHLIIDSVFEPSGEECGTLYEESSSCKICGANRIQKSPLFLKKGTIPNKDIAETIAGEIVVSEKFMNVAKKWNLKGFQFSPINLEKYFQLRVNPVVELSPTTLVGINPFDLSTRNEGEIYKCPNGDTIGLNLLSQPNVQSNPIIEANDLFRSRQNVGVKRGLLRPGPIYFCSPTFRRMIEEEKLAGFAFEIAAIE